MDSDFTSKAEAAMSEGRSEDAIKIYSQAIEADPEMAANYTKRAGVHIKLEQYPDAHLDAEKASKLDPKDSQAFLNKGIALFHLEKFTKAVESLEAGQALNKNDDNFRIWMEKCQEKMKAKVSQKSQDKTPAQPQPEATPLAKQRYDWYQTETHVIITIMIKKCKTEDVRVHYSDKAVSATVKLPSGSDYSLELDLSHTIIPDKSITKILSSKIELKMKKAEGVRWNELEGENELATNYVKADTKSDNVHKYPSSSHHTRNWDKIAQDVEEEEKEEEKKGDAAVNSLFQKIYADGNDEVRKAMNKSFCESGGTVLSTNWDEIGAKKTEIKPPDGMEFKKWDI